MRDHPTSETPLGLVSVLIPAYNVGDHIHTTLKSVTSQTYKNTEIIIIDDGSTDGTPKSCAAWAAKDARIRIIRTNNYGSSAARNTGLRYARGEFVTFVDADDCLSASFISTMLNHLIETHADIAMCRHTSIESKPPNHDGSHDHQLLDAREALLRITYERQQWEVWGKLYRRETWKDVTFPEGLIHQDLAVIPRVFARATAVVDVTDALYYYRTRHGSIMDTVRRSGPSLDLLAILESNIHHAKRYALTPREYNMLLAAYATHASKQLEGMNLSESKRHSEFLGAYKRFAARHRKEVAKCDAISNTYRLAWRLSSVSPILFIAGFHLAKYMKSQRWHGIHLSRSTRKVPT